MKEYAVNRHVLRISWIYLLLWVLAAGVFIVLLAMGSPYWYYAIPGFVFLYLWLMLATLYPKGLVVTAEGVAVTMKGSDKVKLVKFAEMEVGEQEGYYELAVRGKGQGRKYLVAKKNLHPELEEQLQEWMK